MVEQLTRPEGSKVVIEIWADLGCPWCYVESTGSGPRSRNVRTRIGSRSSRVAESVGLDGMRVRKILASDEYADRVRADREEAMELGAAGVPFVVLDRKVAAAGAKKVPAYGQLLDQVAGPVPGERAS